MVSSPVLYPLRLGSTLPNVTTHWDVIVVGGGPAGMTAAAHAAENGARTLLLEKNTVLGKKLLLTGGGRCNVTNATTDRHTLTDRYGKQGVFLYSLFARFGPEDTRDLLHRFGLQTKVEAEGRVFPVTESAASVRDALQRYMEESGVVLRLGQGVTELVVDSAKDPMVVTGVRTSRGSVLSGATVILATGGTARPETGSTGDALPWLETLGVPVRRADTALVPIRVPDGWVRSVQGLALPDAEIVIEGRDTEEHDSATDQKAWANARRVYSQRGKLLFTHFGLSGPLALNAARDIREIAESHGSIRIVINPLPRRDRVAIEGEILDAVATRGKQTLVTLLKAFVPPRLAQAITTIADVPQDQRLATLSKAQRRRIVAALIGLPCSFGGLMGNDKAVVSSGGIAPEAIDFRSMRLRAIPNLFVLGDLIDFNRQSGGYSLQVCWSSGWVAAEAATTA